MYWSFSKERRLCWRSGTNQSTSKCSLCLQEKSNTNRGDRTATKGGNSPAEGITPQVRGGLQVKGQRWTGNTENQSTWWNQTKEWVLIYSFTITCEYWIVLSSVILYYWNYKLRGDKIQQEIKIDCNNQNNIFYNCMLFSIRLLYIFKL